MAANLGAHEIMEIHEVLTDTIDGINQFQLYRPHVKDPQLGSILDNQVNFMNQEYNNLIGLVNRQGMSQGGQYRAPKNFSPTYGLNNPQAQAPNSSMNQMDDQDVASGMLGCHKASATLRIHAALECADPMIRGAIEQGALSCSAQAQEVWQYMNQKGFYQIPTMKQMTTDTMINAYSSSNFSPQGMM